MAVKKNRRSGSSRPDFQKITVGPDLHGLVRIFIELEPELELELDLGLEPGPNPDQTHHTKRMLASVGRTFAFTLAPTRKGALLNCGVTGRGELEPSTCDVD